jgi:energy-coupling factor transport system ATP-binding protein
MIRLVNVTVRYPGAAIPALAGLTLDIPGGSTLAVMGANGSGKSTLARLVASLLSPAEGSITINGVSPADGEAFREVRKKVGMVFQDPRHQITSLTVERDIAFGLQNLKQDDATMKGRINDALEFSGLTLRRASHPMSLSGGEQQRLALAGVLAMEPDILLLDEVTSLLSPASRRHILEVIAADRRRRALTVLMTTQYPEEALAAGRLIVLHGGRKVLDGHPAEVFGHRDELRRFGVGFPGEGS